MLYYNKKDFQVQFLENYEVETSLKSYVHPSVETYLQTYKKEKITKHGRTFVLEAQTLGPPARLTSDSGVYYDS